MEVKKDASKATDKKEFQRKSFLTISVSNFICELDLWVENQTYSCQFKWG